MEIRKFLLENGWDESPVGNFVKDLVWEDLPDYKKNKRVWGGLYSTTEKGEFFSVELGPYELIISTEEDLKNLEWFVKKIAFVGY